MSIWKFPGSFWKFLEVSWKFWKRTKKRWFRPFGIATSKGPVIQKPTPQFFPLSSVQASLSVRCGCCVGVWASFWLPARCVRPFCKNSSASPVSVRRVRRLVRFFTVALSYVVGVWYKLVSVFLSQAACRVVCRTRAWFLLLSPTCAAGYLLGVLRFAVGVCRPHVVCFVLLGLLCLVYSHVLGVFGSTRPYSGCVFFFSAAKLQLFFQLCKKNAKKMCSIRRIAGDEYPCGRLFCAKTEQKRAFLRKNAFCRP